MSKGLIILDEIPVSCCKCPCNIIDSYGFVMCQKSNKKLTTTEVMRCKPNWCPIQKMPEKKGFENVVSTTSLGWIQGWNSCIEMFGGENDFNR